MSNSPSARPSARTVVRAGGLICAIAALIAGWFLLAPPAIGGGTSYAIVDGSSMNPHFRSGDLVLLRAAHRYHVGEIVAYHDRRLGITVLHRIVGRSGERFVTKGDNNPFSDSERPLPAQVVGREWLILPGAGGYLGNVRRPLPAAIAAALLSLLLFGGGFLRKRPESTGPEPGPGGDGAVLAAGALGLVGVFALAGVMLAFHEPAQATQKRPGAYRESGSFTYDAHVPRSIAYPDGRVTTGDAVYRRLAPAVTVRFRYRFASGHRHDLAGSTSLSARLSDGYGWQFTLPLAPALRFRGDHATLSAPIDLGRLERAAQHFEELTGAASGTYQLSLDARVKTRGRLDARPVHTDFSQRLDFTLDATRLTLAQPQSADATGTPITSSRSGGSTTVASANRLALGPLAITVARARRLAPAIALAALLALAVPLARLRRRPRQDAHARVERRHRARLLTIDAAPLIRADAVALRSLDDLAVVGDQPDGPILVAATAAGKHYVRHVGGAQYHYLHERPALVMRATVVDAAQAAEAPPQPLDRLARLNRRRTRKRLSRS